MDRFNWQCRVGVFLFLVSALVAAPFARGNQKGAETVSCETYSKLQAPKFRVARKFLLEPKAGLDLFISISPSDYSHDRLLALVCKLARENADQPLFNLRVFNSYSGAKRYHPQGEGNDSNAVNSFLAWYSFNRETNKHSLEWRPDPADLSQHWVVIKLAPLPTPSPQN
jgi:hypothetical protein